MRLKVTDGGYAEEEPVYVDITSAEQLAVFDFLCDVDFIDYEIIDEKELIYNIEKDYMTNAKKYFK